MGNYHISMGQTMTSVNRDELMRVARSHLDYVNKLINEILD